MMKQTDILVWDLPLRLFHWLLVLSIGVAYITSRLSGSWLQLHLDTGALVVALIAFRFAWGYLGTRYSQFSSFYPSVANLRSFIRSRWHTHGHTPLAALSIYAMLSLILAQAICGLFSFSEDTDIHGLFYKLVSSHWNETLTQWHGALFDMLSAFIVMHIAAVTYYSIVKKQPLAHAMITGRKVTQASNYTTPRVGKLNFFISVLLATLVFWMLSSDVLLAWMHTPTNPVQIGEPVW